MTSLTLQDIQLKQRALTARAERLTDRLINLKHLESMGVNRLSDLPICYAIIQIESELDSCQLHQLLYESLTKLIACETQDSLLSHRDS